MCIRDSHYCEDHTPIYTAQHSATSHFVQTTGIIDTKKIEVQKVVKRKVAFRHDVLSAGTTGNGIITVSYTHLDVYKRQIIIGRASLIGTETALIRFPRRSPARL